mgnify:CR=1 FL=1
MNEEIKRIVELGIDVDNMDEQLFEELGVDVISIVEHPAIEESFLYFSADEVEEDILMDEEMSEEFENAVIEWASENGEQTTVEDIIVDLSKEEFSTVGDVLQGLRATDALQRLNIAPDAQPETFYRYQGSASPQRTFCKAMMRLALSGKIFSRAQITQMDSLNPQFARRDDSSYSIFKWKGGKNCNHYWQKLSVFKGTNNQKVIIVTNPNTNSEVTASNTWAEMFSSASKYDFKVLDNEQRLLYGPIMVPNRMILRRDENGEPFYVYFSGETIRKMAEKFLQQNKLHNTDVEHDGMVTTSNRLVESWVSDSIIHDKSYSMGFALPKNTWYVGYRINDEETWQDIKAGRLKGFSLSGQFINRFTND